MLSKKLYVIPKEDSGSTFENDDKLPNLPLPKLSDTIQIYLESVKPFASNNNEYQKTMKIAKAFEEGIGKVLNLNLLKKAQEERNWLEKFWEDYAYLTLREPLIPYYNITGCINLFPVKNYKDGQQIKFASLVCYHFVELWSLLRTERFKPAKRRDNIPFSMVQYRRYFNCVRVPGQHKDAIRSYFKTEKEGHCSSNVVVLINGNVFVVNGLHGDGTLITPPEWAQQLQIIQKSANKQRGPCVPLLTCDYRNSWAKNRDYLLKLGNEQNLSIIESAMFVLCLDYASPANETQVINLSITGDYTCRWPDKSLNLILFHNGMIGAISEHSMFDGIISVSAFQFVDLAIKEDYNHWQNITQTRQDLEEPVEVTLLIDSFIHNEIQMLYPKLELERHHFIIIREEFKVFGKNDIQKWSIHPDSFVQMALQLSYYKLHSRPGACYESATTRTFYNGRTETVRSCTLEAVSWTKAMLDASVQKKQKADLLYKAIDKHNELMAKAKKNEGCDRHLFGLYCVAMEEELDEPFLFRDTLYKKSGGGGNFVLSTSLAGYTPLGGAYTPMCVDGYGVFYNILPQSIFFSISVTRASKETSTDRFMRSLYESLNDMKGILENYSNSKL